MIPSNCRRLAEGDGFPVSAISQLASAEKRRSTAGLGALHPWFARRPRSSTRAVLLALLLPDPTDPNCPQKFQRAAVASLARAWPAVDLDAADGAVRLRTALFCMIEFIASQEEPGVMYRHIAAALIKAAHGSKPPLVVDPFAGGGTIPLEAASIGCAVEASDLHPVSLLILRTMLEQIPQADLPDLCAKVEARWDEIKILFFAAAKTAEGEYWPHSLGNEMEPIAYVWARSIVCANTACRADLPLIPNLKITDRKMLLLRPQPSSHPSLQSSVRIEIVSTSHGEAAAKEYGATVLRGIATCHCCGEQTPGDEVKRQLAMQNGGADVQWHEQGYRRAGAQLLAVIHRSLNFGTLHTVEPQKKDWDGVRLADKALEDLDEQMEGQLSTADKAQQRLTKSYGIKLHGCIFTRRQLYLVTLLSQLLRAAGAKEEPQMTPVEHAILAMQISKIAEYNNSLCAWGTTASNTQHALQNKQLQFQYLFCETAPYRGRLGGINFSLGPLLSALRNIHAAQQTVAEGAPPTPKVRWRDITSHCATAAPLRAAAIFTDPPYFDAVHFGPLGDFYKPVLRMALPEGNDMRHCWIPQGTEVYPDEEDPLGSYTEQMTKAFENIAHDLSPGGVACVLYAHKDLRAWVAFFEAMVKAGLAVTAGWVIETENTARSNAIGTYSLSAAHHLILRHRSKVKGRHTAKRYKEAQALAVTPAPSTGVGGGNAEARMLIRAMREYTRYANLPSWSVSEHLSREVWELRSSAMGRIRKLAEREIYGTPYKDCLETAFGDYLRKTCRWPQGKASSVSPLLDRRVTLEDLYDRSQYLPLFTLPVYKTGTLALRSLRERVAGALMEEVSGGAEAVDTITAAAQLHSQCAVARRGQAKLFEQSPPAPLGMPPLETLWICCWLLHAGKVEAGVALFAATAAEHPWFETLAREFSVLYTPRHTEYRALHILLQSFSRSQPPPRSGK